MKISIAMATYNGEEYLQEQLDSFLGQTRQPDELVVSDDCSTDRTLEIVERFAMTAPFKVHYYRNKKNLGYAGNFNVVLQHCTGDLVFMSDQDDVWHSSKIEKMAAIFDEQPALQLLIHDLEFCKADLTPIGQTKIERMEEVFDLNKSYVVGMATAVGGSFLKLCLPIPDQAGIAHDGWLHECANAIGKKAIMRDVLALYRRHPSNTTNGSNLNVDFVTTKKHFKRRFNLRDIFKQKTPLVRTEHTPIVRWLQNQKETLIATGLATEQQIDQQIKNCIASNQTLQDRYSILGINRWKRPFYVSKFYLSGGYRQYNGWESALKDVFLN